MVYVVICKQEKRLVHLKKQALIKVKAHVKPLLFNKDLTKILVKYFDNNNVFSVKNGIELPKDIKINNYAIQLENYK